MSDRSILAMQDVEAFVAVAESASFTKAAQRIGTGKSNAGKAVQRLEAHLGTRLFQRTTRAVHLTEDGETYLKAARAALEGLSDAENALAARRAEPAGRVRLDMPSALGRLFLPRLEGIRRSHPKVTLEISLSDRQSDVVAEGWDLVMRIGPLPEQGEMTVRKLCTLRNGLYASPAYIERYGMPLSIADLEHHEAIAFRQGAGTIRPWILDDGTRQIDFLPPTLALIVSEGQALVETALEGFGIAQLCEHTAEPHLKMQRLVHVLPEADVEGAPVHALVPLGRSMPKKTRLVLDALADLMKRPAT